MNSAVYQLRGNRIKLFFMLAATLLFAAGFFIFPIAAVTGAREGMELCAQIVVPSLFPFLALSAFLVKFPPAQLLFRPLNPLIRVLFRLPDRAGAAVVMGLCGGYPAGAQALNTLVQNEDLTKEQASRAILFLVNAGPAFTIGAVGVAMLGDAKAGTLLFIAILLSSLSLGFIHARFATKPEQNKKKERFQKQPSFSQSFVYAATTAGRAVFFICCFVMLFSVVLQMLQASGFPDVFSLFLTRFGVPSELSSCMLPSIFEVAAGCCAAARADILFLPLYAFILSFAGLCVHFQIYSTAFAFSISKRCFLLSRIGCGLCSALIVFILTRLFPTAVSVYAKHKIPSPAPLHSPYSAVILLLCLCIFLLSFKNSVDSSNK